MRQAMFRSLAEPKTLDSESTHPSEHTLYFIANNDNGNPNRILVAQALDNSSHSILDGPAVREGRLRAQFVWMYEMCM